MTELPAFGSPLTMPFWEGARRHELMAQYSPSADRWQFYPRPFLMPTGEHDLEWRALAGTGNIYALTTVRRALMGAMQVPYVVVLVDLDEGVRMLSRCLSPDCSVGDRVRVAWEPRGEDPPYPVFEVGDDA